MKKILKWVLPTFLGIVPVLGAEQQAGLIDDPFFVKTGTACSISRIVENGPKLMAQVTATYQANPASESETRNKIVEAMCATVGWQPNDDQLYAQEIVQAQVICGSDLLEKKHTRALRTPYTVVKETEGRVLQGVPMKATDSLPAGETVDVCKLIEYKRPDGTVYVKSGEKLYQLLLEETRVAGAAFRHCRKEWEIISQFKRKTRHQVQTYNRTDVTQIEWRIPQTGDRLELSKKVIVELTPGLYEPEVPTCGQTTLPVGYVIKS